MELQVFKVSKMYTLRIILTDDVTIPHDIVVSKTNFFDQIKIKGAAGIYIFFNFTM